MKVKIVSDRTIPGTRLCSAETGEVIEQIRVVNWWLAAPGLAMASLEMCEVPVDVIGTVQPRAAEGDAECP